MSVRSKIIVLQWCIKYFIGSLWIGKPVLLTKVKHDVNRKIIYLLKTKYLKAVLSMFLRGGVGDTDPDSNVSSSRTALCSLSHCFSVRPRWALLKVQMILAVTPGATDLWEVPQGRCDKPMT